MATTPLMPKATAVWLVDNTSLSFDQIADFCKLHPLEVKAIADGEAAQGIKGLDPVMTGQLSRDEIEKGQVDTGYRLKLQESKTRVPEAKRKGPRYTPVSRRQDRPNAILWLVRNHPELKDAQVMRLVGTTKPTILAIRERTHWNSANLTPSDPVTLGLCSQIELDLEVERASKNLPPRPEGEHHEETLLPAEETTSEDAMAAAFARTTSTPQPQEEEFDADAVFAKLNALKGRSDEETDEDAAGEDATGEDATDEASGSDETASAEQPGEDDEQR
ncbi:MAG: cytoplasmic protein [Stappia sp.]|nr:cytoplasmic protein [Stappia sp.]MBM21642.1 cytoplasmic protein [Stappia sp.]